MSFRVFLTLLAGSLFAGCSGWAVQKGDYHIAFVNASYAIYLITVAAVRSAKEDQ